MLCSSNLNVHLVSTAKKVVTRLKIDEFPDYEKLSPAEREVCVCLCEEHVLCAALGRLIYTFINLTRLLVFEDDILAKFSYHSLTCYICGLYLLFSLRLLQLCCRVCFPCGVVSFLCCCGELFLLWWAFSVVWQSFFHAVTILSYNFSFHVTWWLFSAWCLLSWGWCLLSWGGVHGPEKYWCLGFANYLFCCLCFFCASGVLIDFLNLRSLLLLPSSFLHASLLKMVFNHCRNIL